MGEMKDFCNEKYKSLQKEIEKDIRRRKLSYAPGSENQYCEKWLYYQKKCICSLQYPLKFQ
jgi:DTW domain-containing protein YfiP